MLDSWGWASWQSYSATENPGCPGASGPWNPRNDVWYPWRNKQQQQDTSTLCWRKAMRAKGESFSSAMPTVIYLSWYQNVLSTLRVSLPTSISSSIEAPNSDDSKGGKFNWKTITTETGKNPERERYSYKWLQNRIMIKYSESRKGWAYDKSGCKTAAGSKALSFGTHELALGLGCLAAFWRQIHEEPMSWILFFWPILVHFTVANRLQD